MKYLGDLEKCDQQFVETCSTKNVGDLEKCCRRFGENCSAKMLEIWRNVVGDLEKTVWQKTLEIWRNVVGIVMAISYWSLLRSSLELGDRKWRLNHNGDKLWRPKLYSSWSGEYISGAFQG